MGSTSLDRDGTLNEDVPYCSRPEDLRLFPKAEEAVRLLNQADFKVAVVTNQSGIARGYFTEEDLHSIHQELQRKLARVGAHIDGFYYCSHHPDAGCQCRKPRTGLIQRAAQELATNLSRSFVVGDGLHDVQMGKAVGCTTIRISYPQGSNPRDQLDANPDYVTNNLYEAVIWILADDNRRPPEGSVSV